MKKTKNIGEVNTQKRNIKTFWIYFLSFLTCALTIILFHFTENEVIESVVPLIIGLILMMVFIMYLNWAWFDNMDEFEKLIIGKASFWGLSSATIVVPWMLLNELGLVSEPNAYFIIVFAFSVTLALYYFEKFSSR